MRILLLLLAVALSCDAIFQVEYPEHSTDANEVPRNTPNELSRSGTPIRHHPENLSDTNGPRTDLGPPKPTRHFKIKFSYQLKHLQNVHTPLDNLQVTVPLFFGIIPSKPLKLFKPDPAFQQYSRSVFTLHQSGVVRPIRIQLSSVKLFPKNGTFLSQPNISTTVKAALDSNEIEEDFNVKNEDKVFNEKDKKNMSKTVDINEDLVPKLDEDAAGLSSNKPTGAYSRIDQLYEALSKPTNYHYKSDKLGNNDISEVIDPPRLLRMKRASNYGDLGVLKSETFAGKALTTSQRFSSPKELRKSSKLRLPITNQLFEKYGVAFVPVSAPDDSVKVLPQHPFKLWRFFAYTNANPSTSFIDINRFQGNPANENSTPQLRWKKPKKITINVGVPVYLKPKPISNEALNLPLPDVGKTVSKPQNSYGIPSKRTRRSLINNPIFDSVFSARGDNSKSFAHKFFEGSRLRDNNAWFQGSTNSPLNLQVRKPILNFSPPKTKFAGMFRKPSQPRKVNKVKINYGVPVYLKQIVDESRSVKVPQSKQPQSKIRINYVPVYLKPQPNSDSYGYLKSFVVPKPFRDLDLKLPKLFKSRPFNKSVPPNQGNRYKRSLTSSPIFESVFSGFDKSKTLEEKFFQGNHYVPNYDEHQEYHGHSTDHHASEAHHSFDNYGPPVEQPFAHYGLPIEHRFDQYGFPIEHLFDQYEHPFAHYKLPIEQLSDQYGTPVEQPSKSIPNQHLVDQKATLPQPQLFTKTDGLTKPTRQPKITINYDVPVYLRPVFNTGNVEKPFDGTLKLPIVPQPNGSESKAKVVGINDLVLPIALSPNTFKLNNVTFPGNKTTLGNTVTYSYFLGQNEKKTHNPKTSNASVSLQLPQYHVPTTLVGFLGLDRIKSQPNQIPNDLKHMHFKDSNKSSTLGPLIQLQVPKETSFSQFEGSKVSYFTSTVPVLQVPRENERVPNLYKVVQFQDHIDVHVPTIQDPKKSGLKQFSNLEQKLNNMNYKESKVPDVAFSVPVLQVSKEDKYVPNKDKLIQFKKPIEVPIIVPTIHLQAPKEKSLKEFIEKLNNISSKGNTVENTALSAPVLQVPKEDRRVPNQHKLFQFNNPTKIAVVPKIQLQVPNEESLKQFSRNLNKENAVPEKTYVPIEHKLVQFKNASEIPAGNPMIQLGVPTRLGNSWRNWNNILSLNWNNTPIFQVPTEHRPIHFNNTISANTSVLDHKQTNSNNYISLEGSSNQIPGQFHVPVSEDSLTVPKENVGKPFNNDSGSGLVSNLMPPGLPETGATISGQAGNVNLPKALADNVKYNSLFVSHKVAQQVDGVHNGDKVPNVSSGIEFHGSAPFVSKVVDFSKATFQANEKPLEGVEESERFIKNEDGAKDEEQGSAFVLNEFELDEKLLKSKSNLVNQHPLEKSIKFHSHFSPNNLNKSVDVTRRPIKNLVISTLKNPNRQLAGLSLPKELKKYMFKENAILLPKVDMNTPQFAQENLVHATKYTSVILNNRARGQAEEDGIAEVNLTKDQKGLPNENKNTTFSVQQNSVPETKFTSVVANNRSKGQEEVKVSEVNSTKGNNRHKNIVAEFFNNRTLARTKNYESLQMISQNVTSLPKNGINAISFVKNESLQLHGSKGEDGKNMMEKTIAFSKSERSDVPVAEDVSRKRPFSQHNSTISSLQSRNSTFPWKLRNNTITNIRKNVTRTHNVTNSNSRSRYVIRKRIRTVVKSKHFKNATTIPASNFNVDELTPTTVLNNGLNFVDFDGDNVESESQKNKIILKVIKRPLGNRKNLVASLLNKERSNGSL